MLNLNFRTAGEIVAEPGGSARLGEIASGLGCARILVVTDAGVRKIGLLDAGLAGLKQAGIAVSVYDGVLADPPEAVIEDALAAGRSHRADGVIGFGGGSSMDVAKLAAFLLNSDQKLQDTYGLGKCEGDRLPLIQVPTTAGTGSEVTPIAVVTIAGADKMGVVSPQLYGDVALLDADLTMGLPAPVTAATGLDAMVHAIEAYTSKHKKNAISDALAREALTLLAGNIRTACKTPDDRAARAGMLLGACLAGMAFANAPVAAVHALAYPIGGHFHVPHGLSNSLVMPHVMRFNKPDAAALYAELAPLIDPGITPGPPEAMADALIASIEALIADLAIDSTLRQVGISHNHLPMLAEDAMKQTRLLVNNPREVSYDDAMRIYEAAL